MLLFFSTFIFAENIITIKPTFTTGAIGHKNGDNIIEGTKLGLSLTGEYLYVFSSGLSVGTDISVLASTFTESTDVNSYLTASVVLHGGGFSIAPALGWTFNNRSLIQIVLFPIIFETISYNVDYTIGNRNMTTQYRIDYKALKSGICGNFEWGWNTFKLGFSVGANVIWNDNYRDGANFGLEFTSSGNVSFLF